MQFQSTYISSVLYSRWLAIFIICILSSVCQPTNTTRVMTVQIRNNEILDICINNTVRAFHLNIKMAEISHCYYRTEIYLPGGSGGINKTENDKCCMELMLQDTVISTDNFTLRYKIIIGPIKKNISIIIKDAHTKEVLDEVTLQRNYGNYKKIQFKEQKLELQMIFPRKCFTLLMIIMFETQSEKCTFTLDKVGATKVVTKKRKGTFCSTIAFKNGKFLTHHEMLLKFEAKSQIYENILVKMRFNKVMLGYSYVKADRFVTDGNKKTTSSKRTVPKESKNTLSNDIVTEEINYIPNKIVVSSSSSNNVDDPRTQIYLKLPLLKEIVGNISKLSVVVAQSNGIISKSGIVKQPDTFIDKTYLQCQIDQYYQEQWQDTWTGCVYEINITDFLSLAFDAQLNYTGFVLGEMKKCKKQKKYFCNGSLKSGYIYNVSLRSYSHYNGKYGTYKTTEPLEVRTQIDTTMPLEMWFVTGAAAGVAVIILTISIITVVCIKVRRNKNQNHRTVERTDEVNFDHEDVYSYIRPRAESSNIRQLPENNSVYSVIEDSHEPHYEYIAHDIVPVETTYENDMDDDATHAVAVVNTVEMSNAYEYGPQNIKLNKIVT